MAFAMSCLFALAARRAGAHCDTLDGPVVLAGKKAIETGNLNHALIWVQPEAEAELKALFKKTLKVRKLGTEAREVADMYFFETLVRLHRAGEGEPYTGLVPAGTDLGPAIPAADKAIRDGSGDGLRVLLFEAIEHGIEHRLERVLAAKSFKPDDVAAGRAWVAGYVGFLHYVEHVYQAAAGSAESHAAAEHVNEP